MAAKRAATAAYGLAVGGRLYKQAFDLDVADRLDFPDFTLVYMSNAESAFELAGNGRTGCWAEGF